MSDSNVVRFAGNALPQGGKPGAAELAGPGEEQLLAELGELTMYALARKARRDGQPMQPTLRPQAGEERS